MPRSEAQKAADRRYEREKGKKRKRRYRRRKSLIDKALKESRTCSECGAKHYAKGLCSRHYQAQRKAAKKRT